MKALALIASLAIAGCAGIYVPEPAPDSDLLGRMCLHLQKLGCEEGADVYNEDILGPVDVPNQSCEAFYESLQEDGYAVNPRCVLLAPSCESIEDYRDKDPKACRTFQ